jgi:hypothetical protein
MKGLAKTAVLVAALAVAGLALAGGDTWFDMENCAFCKNLSEDPELLNHMTWEQYSISNGVISVTTVEEAYASSYKKANENMAEVSKRMQKGEQLPTCNSCSTAGMFMMKGVKSESVPTKHGDIWIMTSDDPAVVEEMQKWTMKNMEELKKLEASEG